MSYIAYSTSTSRDSRTPWVLFGMLYRCEGDTQTVALFTATSTGKSNLQRTTFYIRGFFRCSFSHLWHFFLHLLHISPLRCSQSVQRFRLLNISSFQNQYPRPLSIIHLSPEYMSKQKILYRQHCLLVHERLLGISNMQETQLLLR